MYVLDCFLFIARLPLTNALIFQICGEAQGDESQLNDFFTYLRKGPPAADLVGTEIDELRPNYNERDFFSAPDGCESFVYEATSPSMVTGSATSTSEMTSRSTISRVSSGSIIKFNWKA